MNVWVSMTISLFIVIHGYNKSSLSLSGAITAFFVGFAALVAGYDYGAGLISFYVSSSLLTKIGELKKGKMEANFKKGGNRNMYQVLSNGGLGLLLCVIYIFFGASMNDTQIRALKIAYMCHYAVCCGDTWASEIGSPFGGKPWLVTSWRRVPAGTNGGVSLLGLISSFLGGAFIGLMYFIADRYFAYYCLAFPSAFHSTLWGGFFGFVGSLLDSILGATLQVSYYSVSQHQIVKFPKPSSDIKLISGFNVLTNSQINFISSLIVAALTWANSTFDLLY